MEFLHTKISFLGKKNGCIKNTAKVSFMVFSDTQSAVISVPWPRLCLSFVRAFTSCWTASAAVAITRRDSER